MKLRNFDNQGGPAPQRVLITRLSAIGDCILTLPVAVKVKELWPECRVSWTVDCAAATLLEHHPAVDEVLRIEKRWLTHPAHWGTLRGQLQQRKFDLVLDPQGLSKSALLGKLSGANLRIGFDYSHAREMAPWLATHRLRRTARHMVDTYLQLLSPWTNLSPGSGEFRMPIYTASVERAEEILQALELNSAPEKLPTNAQPWIAMNVGAGWSSKQWPPERFGWIAQQMWQRHGLRSLVLWAGDNEHALAEQVVVQGAGAAVAAPATSLCELVELIRRSQMLISGDTSPLHIASATKTPCVGLFGPTWADECGPYGNKHIAIQSSVLPDPRRGHRRSSNSSINAIEISEVLRACTHLLAQIGSTSGNRMNNQAA